MSQTDLHIGAVVMVGSQNWSRASWRRKLAVFLFCKRQRFVHLGMRLTVAWRDEKPYLLRISEGP